MTMGSDDRASAAFNRGYRDGRDGRDDHAEYTLGTFGAYDYAEGHRAALNDARLDAARAAARRGAWLYGKSRLT